MRILAASSDPRDMNQICSLYYQYSGVLIKHKRRYLNRKFLLNISTSCDCQAITEVINSGTYDEQRLHGEEFVRLTRLLVWYFLNTVCIIMMMTSKKTRKDLVRQHLARRR